MYKKKKKNEEIQRRRSGPHSIETQYFVHFVIWGVTTYALIMWLAFRGKTCLPKYESDYSQIIRYSELLSQHTQSPILAIQIALAIIGIDLVIGLILLNKFKGLMWLMAGSAYIYLVGIAFCISSAGGWVFSCLSTSTHLEHLDTVEFEGHIYQLTYGSEYSAIEYIQRNKFFLFKCELDGDTCQGREYYSTVARIEMPTLSVDKDANHFEIVSNGTVYFIVDIDTMNKIFRSPE